MADGTCAVPACLEPIRSRGLCNPHYQRFHKYGNPEGVSTREHVRRPAANRAKRDPDLPGYLPCTGCKQQKPEKDFCFSGQAPHRNNRAHRCRSCRKEYENARYARDSEKVRERVRWAMAKYKYGLTREQYEGMVRDRDGLCDICKRPDAERRLCVDHDHSCCPTDKTCGKCIRGLLCNLCNRLIGLARDSPTSLETAAVYLRSWSRSP